MDCTESKQILNCYRYLVESSGNVKTTIYTYSILYQEAVLKFKCVVSKKVFLREKKLRYNFDPNVSQPFFSLLKKFGPIEKFNSLYHSLKFYQTFIKHAVYMHFTRQHVNNRQLTFIKSVPLNISL